MVQNTVFEQCVCSPLHPLAEECVFYWFGFRAQPSMLTDFLAVEGCWRSTDFSSWIPRWWHRRVGSFISRLCFTYSTAPARNRTSSASIALCHFHLWIWRSLLATASQRFDWPPHLSPAWIQAMFAWLYCFSLSSWLFSSSCRWSYSETILDLWYWRPCGATLFHSSIFQLSCIDDLFLLQPKSSAPLPARRLHVGFRTYSCCYYINWCE